MDKRSFLRYSRLLGNRTLVWRTELVAVTPKHGRGDFGLILSAFGSIKRTLTPHFFHVAVHSEIHLRDDSPATHPASVVLIIDDDDAIRALSQCVIQRAGFEVLTARDGPEGLEAFRAAQSRIGLILCDLTMPRMTGAEVIAGLMALGAKVPIVLITGYGEDAVRDDERIGISGVLQKPFLPEDLRGLLQRYLRSAVAPSL